MFLKFFGHAGFGSRRCSAVEGYGFTAVEVIVCLINDALQNQRLKKEATRNFADLFDV